MVDWEDFYGSFRQPGFIPGYEIQNRLGGGAFGEVYKAKKLSIGKHYAIKFLKLGDQADREAVERELEQVRLFASIDHPNLVTIEDMGLVREVPYLVMGYAGEETLARKLKRCDLGDEEALRFFVQVCRGVLALHDRRLAHFDLKPGNVFLKGDVARVGDYGLAKLLIEGRQSLSFGRGTPHYMAPEMLKNRADHRADIYSLGVILYECLTNRLPFDMGSDYGVILRENDDPPEFPRGFPISVRPTVERCLRLAPENRFDTVHELLDDLGQTARQGDSIRIPWTAPLALPQAGGEVGEGTRPKTDAAAAAEEGATAGADLRQAATELARGAALVARGVWEGVVGRGDDRDEGPPAPEGVQAAAAAASEDGGDVVSVQTLAESDGPREVLARPPGEPTPPYRARSVQERGDRGHERGDREGPLAIGAPAASVVGPGVTVPVPPRDQGGLFGTAAAAAVLGAEIMVALVTGPLVYVLRGIGSGVDRVARGLPGVLGAIVRLILFILLFAGLGALVALLFMVGLMSGEVFEP
ncbi:MAG: serine/threonine-protein kinase [Planctomycetota bacterium]|nr:serine/threonine-protein kinase [Planctomycetota bacterium]